LLAGTALALMVGIAVGTSLGKAPRASLGLLPFAQDSLQLRLDDTLTSSASGRQRAVPRDRSAPR
jgi:hypothetical protein